MSEPITTSSPQASIVTGARRSPGQRRLGPLGNALDIGHNALSFSREMWQRYGGVVRTRFLFAPAYLLFHPEHVKRVLQDNHRHYDKQFPTMGAVRNVMGNGLFLSDGESWLHQRRLMQPTFHRKRVAALGTLMTDATLALLTQWRERAERDQPLDIPKEMTHLTLHIVGQALFHVDLSAQTALVGQSFTELLPLLLEYSSLPFPPIFLPTARNRRIQSTLNMIDTIVYQILNAAQYRTRADPRLLLARRLGVLLTLFLLAFFMFSLPEYWTQLQMVCIQSNCPPWQLSATQARALQHAGLSLPFYAIGRLTLDLFCLLIWFAVSACIAWRGPRDWMTLLVSLFLITQAIAQFTGNLALPLHYLSRGWDIPTLFLLYVSSALPA